MNNEEVIIMKNKHRALALLLTAAMLLTFMPTMVFADDEQDDPDSKYPKATAEYIEFSINHAALTCDCGACTNNFYDGYVENGDIICVNLMDKENAQQSTEIQYKYDSQTGCFVDKNGNTAEVGFDMTVLD